MSRSSGSTGPASSGGVRAGERPERRSPDLHVTPDASSRPSAGGVVVYRVGKQRVDSIDEHSRRLVRALVDAGHPATYVPDGLAAVRRARSRPDWILLQYMPFSYGRWGVAPGLIRDAIALKRTTGARLGVLVHEAWIAMTDWRSCLLGGYQRLQLRSLMRVADAIAATTQPVAEALGGGAVHVPVGSNITPTAIARDVARSRLGIDDELVVTLFGRGHPHRALEHAEEALGALVARQGADTLRVFNLGVDAPALQVPSGLRVDTPGELPAESVSLHLRASDLLLMTFTDGVSTRRTTLMAGLAHALPVIGLRGTSTDGMLLRHPEALVLTPAGDRDAFARAVLDITADPARLRSTGTAARALYANNFDWPAAVQRLLSALNQPDGGSSHSPRAEA